MKRTLLLVFALVLVLVAAVATPATATKAGPLGGDEEITLYLVECPNDNAPGPLLTWAGTVEFGRWTVGKAYFPTADLMPLGDEGWVYFEDYWTLFKLPHGDFTEDELIAAACNPRRVLMAGVDAGVATPWGTGFAIGEVERARKWLRGYVGATVFWNGAYANEAGDEFVSTFWILPAWPR